MQLASNGGSMERGKGGISPYFPFGLHCV